jgi:dienelactone hydrolase
MRHRLACAALAMTLVGPSAASAEEPPKIEKRAIEYRDGDTVLEGHYVASTNRGRRPGVVVVPEWWGLGEHAKRKAEELADLGYAALAVDMYGKGKLTKDPKQAGEWASAFRGEANRDAARRRAAAGLAVLVAQKEVDASKLAAIGFCFGGGVALELAYSGADLDATVCFHGNPAPLRAGDATPQGTILVCHGADDPNVKVEALRAFEKSMKDSKADWMFVQYGNAVHSFTNPEAKSESARYEERADRRSWAHLKALFAERLGSV